VLLYSSNSREFKPPNQWCSGKFGTGRTLRSLLLPSFPSPLSYFSLPSFLPSLPLEVGPLNPARGRGNAVREFGAF